MEHTFKITCDACIVCHSCSTVAVALGHPDLSCTAGPMAVTFPFCFTWEGIADSIQIVPTERSNLI